MGKCLSVLQKNPSSVGLCASFEGFMKQVRDHILGEEIADVVVARFWVLKSLSEVSMFLTMLGNSTG